MYKKIIYLLLIFVFLPTVVNAQATMYVSPSSGTYKVGEMFSAVVSLNSGGQSINAGMGQINFDNTRLEVVSLGYSQSIFSLWTENPKFSNVAGSVSFGGGVPSPGFNGASGAILRITFKAKDSGQAPISFVSGSVLANDGQGSNILDSMRGSIVTINESVVPTQKPLEDKKEDIEVVAERVLPPPSISIYPEKLDSGETLTIEGLGNPLTKISVVIQKGNGELIYEHTFSGPDGKFRFTYSKKVETGFYRVWAKNVTESGLESGLSEPVTVEIISSTFFRLGGLVLDYVTIILTLLSLFTITIMSLLFVWLKYTQVKKLRGKEIHEAEEVLHKSFDNLKEGLVQYINYVSSAKTSSAIKKREQKTRIELKSQLDSIEQDIKKEIDDIKKPRKSKKVE